MRKFLKSSLETGFLKTMPKLNMERTIVAVHAMLSIPYANRVDYLQGGYSLKGISDQDFKLICQLGTKTPLSWSLKVVNKLLTYAKKEYQVEISLKDFWVTYWTNRGSKPKEAFVILEQTKSLDIALDLFSYVNPQFIIQHFPRLNAIELMNLISAEFFFVEEKGFILHSEKNTYGNGEVPLYIINNMNPNKKVGSHYKSLWWIKSMGRIDYKDLSNVYSFIKKGSTLLEVVSKTNMSHYEASDSTDIFKIKNYYGIKLSFSTVDIEHYWPKLTRPHKVFIINYFIHNKISLPIFIVKKINEEELNVPISLLVSLIKNQDHSVFTRGYLIKYLLKHPQFESEINVLFNTLDLSLFPIFALPEVYRRCLKQKNEIKNIPTSDKTLEIIENIESRLRWIEYKTQNKFKGRDRLLMIFKK